MSSTSAAARPTELLDLKCLGLEVNVTFEVVDVVRPILSVSRLVEKGFDVVVGAGEARLQRKEKDGNVVCVPLRQRAGLYFLHVERATDGLIAPVVRLRGAGPRTFRFSATVAGRGHRDGGRDQWSRGGGPGSGTGRAS